MIPQLYNSSCWFYLISLGVWLLTNSPYPDILEGWNRKISYGFTSILMKNMKIISAKYKTRATQSVAYYLAHKFDPVTLTFNLWPWKSTGFQIFLQIKYVPSLVKIHWRMLILDCSQGCYGRTVALLYPFATSLARG